MLLEHVLFLYSFILFQVEEGQERKYKHTLPVKGELPQESCINKKNSFTRLHRLIMCVTAGRAAGSSVRPAGSKVKLDTSILMGYCDGLFMLHEWHRIIFSMAKE